jgi:hypothetical protein
MHHLPAHGATARTRRMVVSVRISKCVGDHHSSQFSPESPRCFLSQLTDLNLNHNNWCRYNCSLPELGLDGIPIPGKYGKYCQPWDEAAWAPAMRPLAALVRANAPSGIPGNNFMCGASCSVSHSACIMNELAVLILHDVVCMSQGWNTSTPGASVLPLAATEINLSLLRSALCLAGW